MLTEKNKKLIIIISSVLAVVLVGIIITACVILIPMKGSAYNEKWLGPYQAYDLQKDAVVVQKEAGEDFVITQLTDIQLWSNAKDNEEAFEIAEKVIQRTQPNLVVFTGDNVSGVSAPELLKKFVKKIEALAVKYDFLWAPIFGNHDTEFGSRTTKNWAGDQYLTVSTKNGGHCLFSKGPTNLGDSYGDLLGNYVIVVKESDQIVQSLFMIDNGSYADYEDDIREAVQSAEGRGRNSERPFPYAQIEWFKWQASNINKIAGKIVPSIAFTHCAPYEMGQTIRKYVAGADGKVGTDDDLKKQDPEGYWTLPGGYSSGNNNSNQPSIKPASEEVYPLVDGKPLRGIAGRIAYVPGYAMYNTGIVDSLKGLGLKGWFVGHDHENDIIFEYDGMVYGYGMKAGPSPKPWNDSYFFGGTKIVMNQAGDITPEHCAVIKASDYWKK